MTALSSTPEWRTLCLDYVADVGGWVRALHGDKEYDLVVVERGTVQIEVEGHLVCLASGDATLIAPTRFTGASPGSLRLFGSQAAVERLLTIAVTKLQWEAGARDVAAIDPAMRTLDQALLDLPGRKRAAEALLWDDQNNPGRYPEWQAYLREHQPPLLAIWGANDPFLIPPGAEAYERDLPTAQVVLLDTGHFALVEDPSRSSRGWPRPDGTGARLAATRAAISRVELRAKRGPGVPSRRRHAAWLRHEFRDWQSS